MTNTHFTQIIIDLKPLTFDIYEFELTEHPEMHDCWRIEGTTTNEDNP